MKKAILLLILSVFLISIFAASCVAPDDSFWSKLTGKSKPASRGTLDVYSKGESTTMTGMLNKLLDTLDGIIGKIFGMVSKTPSVWLKVLFFIAIYAILFQVFQMKTMQHVLDRKTAGILGFVISFATVALMPEPWLYLVVDMYGGLIMTLILLLPLIWGVTQTRKAMKAKVKGFEMFIVAIAWVLYLLIMSTAFDTLDRSGIIVRSGPLIWFQTIAFLISGVMIVLAVWLTFSGKGNKSIKESKSIGDWFGFKGGKELEFDKISDEAENVANNLKTAADKAHTPGKTTQAMVERAIANVELAQEILINEGYDFLQEKIDETKDLGADTADNQENRNRLRDIKSINSQIQTIIGAVNEEIKNPTGAGGAINFPQIQTDLNSITGEAKTVISLINTIEKLYEKTKKATAKKTP